MKRVAAKADYSTVRIIAGRWRGRKLRFLTAGVRPTGDRVRETLFNWLTPYLPGARCLDLFAGTGVLGVEALSRGAAEVLLVEQSRAVAAEITAQLAVLEASGAQVHCADALKTDLAARGPFDIVFVDPPFTAVSKAEDGDAAGPGLRLSDLCTLLESSGALADPCRIYLEMERSLALPELPANWRVLREKTAGKVRFALTERSTSDTTEQE